MESAKTFAERFAYTYTSGRSNLRDLLIKFIESRDTAIRKECADRGVKWAMTALGPLIMNSETRDELRAAIMGDKHD